LAREPEIKIDKLSEVLIIGGLSGAKSSTLFNNTIKIICVGACEGCRCVKKTFDTRTTR